VSRLRVEFWWWLERQSGRLWWWAARGADRVTVPWLDWLPAWTYRHRKAAERRAYEQRTGKLL